MESIHKKYDHVGWIPCVSGHLIFESSECGLPEKKSEIHLDVNCIERESEAQEHHQYIAVSSNVNWKDEKTRLDGRFRVVLLASAAIGASQLEGQVYLLPRKHKEWEEKGIDNILSEIKRLTLVEENIKNKFYELQSTLNGLPADKSFITNFSLIRSGFVFLRHNTRGTQVAPETPITIARQSYYYIKNTFHKHAHHDKSDESLTTTHPLPNDLKSIGMMVSNDLKKSIVLLKRNLESSNYKHLLHVKGIVSYAKSLLVSCEKEGFLDAKDFLSEKAYFENLGESLEIIAKKIEKQLTDQERISSNFRAMVLFVVSIVAPITIIFREQIRKGMEPREPSLLIETIGNIAQSDFNIIILVCLILIAYWLYSRAVFNYGSLAFARAKLDRKIANITLNIRSARIITNTILIVGIVLMVLKLLKLE